jgi:hypothetical protein
VCARLGELLAEVGHLRGGHQLAVDRVDPAAVILDLDVDERLVERVALGDLLEGLDLLLGVALDVVAEAAVARAQAA